MLDQESSVRNELVSGKYKMIFERSDHYVGHYGEDYDVLKDYKPVDNGFNLIFKAPKGHFKVDTIESNSVHLTIAEKNPHFTKTSTFSVDIENGKLYSVFLDEIIRHGVAHTVLGLRVKD